ncbi:MAG: hypothetical protein M0Z77_07100 [Thermoplasmatales archaeon]|jgi:hypothetical protein|nr:hypothetical protein [Candidatus Thermoplasmatota archaeon]MCL6003318.1 hypothetical protein [Candidatus Thermoplasmatota archaeon]MDA8055400.1 hypothetical protein [Thermoplasmatales archaeon]
MGITKPTKKEKGIAIGVGIAFMVLALIPQMITQEIPTIIVLLKYGVANLIPVMTKFELTNPIIWSLFVGGTAAVYQESMKYFSVNTQNKYLTIWIGLGFALVDLAVLYFQGLPLLVRAFSLIPLILITLNTLSSLLFHPGTALMLKYGRTVGKGVYFLLFTILLHGIEDGGLVFTDIFVIHNPGLYLEAIAVFWGITISISIASIIMGLSFRSRLYEMSGDENTI